MVRIPEQCVLKTIKRRLDSHIPNSIHFVILFMTDDMVCFGKNRHAVRDVT